MTVFVTGTGKNPQKTLVTTGLALTTQSLGYQTAFYKPVCTGAAGTPKEIALVNKFDPHIQTRAGYAFTEDRDPFMAAFAQNETINPLELLNDYKKITAENELVFVDGNDGPATPVAENFTEETMIKWFNIPVIFVVQAADAAAATDVINESLRREVKTRGIILTGYAEQYKFLPQTLEKNTALPVLGVLNTLPNNIRAADLIAEIITRVNLETALNMKIAKL